MSLAPEEVYLGEAHPSLMPFPAFRNAVFARGDPEAKPSVHAPVALGATSMWHKANMNRCTWVAIRPAMML